ncbi:MAG: pilus assembly protein [Gammaproteobacteria bacterium]|nr:pilus assembly protein [Gammaproteobacteria bacterium]
MRARTILGKNSEAAMSLSKRLRQLGQGMTEYIIIVGLIAVGIIVAVFNFKEILRVTTEGGTAEFGKHNIGSPTGGGPGGDDDGGAIGPPAGMGMQP